MKPMDFKSKKAVYFTHYHREHGNLHVFDVCELRVDSFSPMVLNLFGIRMCIHKHNTACGMCLC